MVQIGELVWDPNPDAQDKVISLQREADLSRRDQWPEYCRWMVETTERFRTVFGPRVKKLDLERVQEEVGEPKG